jgi:hypothetical protein
MGACDFATVGRGKTAAEAFKSIVDDARYEYGHGGYTGTIAEKHDFKLCKPQSTERSEIFREAQDYDAWERLGVHDKWGPAGCFQLGPDEWLFFGMAPS